jgi:hypothetical protein
LCDFTSWHNSATAPLSCSVESRPTHSLRAADMKQYWVPVLIVLIVATAVGWWNWGRTSAPSSDPIPEFTGLDETKQKEIWDAEHATFEIETHVGRKLVAALQSRKTDQLARFFRPGFEGNIPGRSHPTTIDKSSITETVNRAESADVANVDADGLIQFLITGTVRINKIQRGRFRVLKIARDEGEGNEDEWRLSVLLTVGGINSEGRPITYDSHGSIRCRFTDDEDIVAGRIVESWEIDSETTRLGRDPLMEEVTAQFGLDQLPIIDNWNCDVDQVRQYRFQTAVEDFGGDGVPDIAVATADDQQLLLQWNSVSGKYDDITKSAGLPRRFETNNKAYLACWFDFDNDGDADLLLGETLYRNVDGKKLEAVADNGGLTFDYNPMGCVVADYDADGLLDLYVLYQRPRNETRDAPPTWVSDDASGAFNQLWRNRGDGTFVEKSREAKATGGSRHSFAATWLHANDDHFPDLYIANDFSRNSLLINRGDGTFRDVAEESGVGDFATSMGVATGDIDGDGTPEIYVANMYSKMGRRIIAHVSEADYPEGVYQQILGSCAGNRLYSNAGDRGGYRDLSEQLGVNAVGWAYAPAFIDFDGDGRLDLYATTGFLSFNRRKPDG